MHSARALGWQSIAVAFTVRYTLLFRELWIVIRLSLLQEEEIENKYCVIPRVAQVV